MRRLRIGVLDLVTKSPNPSLYGRLMNANLASIMPQVIGVWCEQEGHDVRLVCYTGIENLLEELPLDLDVLFIGAFTQSAQLAYALSNFFRRRGAITVLGGPHARCYPEDACRYFDYVLGFTDRGVVSDMLQDCAPHRPIGQYLTAASQPVEMPSLQERWKFVEATLKKAPTIKIVPMIGSLGCPYTCSFCIDSTVDYQPLGFEQLRDDLAFLLTKMKDPIVGWHDPNFGVRFDDYMEAVEAAAPQGAMRHIAESSLSLLSEPHLKRLRKNGFRAILPGIESWYDLGNKSKTRRTGMDKVRAGGGSCEHDPPLHPLYPDQLRSRTRRRHGAGAVRAYQDVHRPGSGRVPCLLAAVCVRARRADESRIPACRASPAVPLPFPEQQSRDERQAQELHLDRVL